jgi:hypothetical protein
MPEQYYDADFPNLRKFGFKRTSEPAYPNCISFVVGDNKRRWWPGEYPLWSPDYWPKAPSSTAETPNDATLEVFKLGLATENFVECNDGKWAPGFEKIALYGRGREITHAALQIAEDKWMSKLGGDEDIEHTLDGLEGPLFGIVVAYLQRQRKGQPKP